MPVLGPLVAYVQTPRNNTGRLNEVMLETLIRNAAEAGVNTITVLGSVGGSAYMPRSMRKRVISTAVKAADGAVPVIAGVGALTTAEVAANLSEAAEAGATGALLQPMSYQPLLPHEVTYLYEQANSVTHIPLWVYNNPATTRHAFTLNELVHIAQLDNVAGFKDRAANTTEVKHRIAHVSQSLSPERAAKFDWGFSGETKGALVLGSGASSWHSALAGIMPSICVELADAAVEGQNDPEIAAFALQMQRALNPLTVIMTQYGGIRVAHAIGLIKGQDVGELPQPLLPLPAAIFGLVDLALQSVELSLRALQEQLLRGGIPAANDAVLQGNFTARRAETQQAQPAQPEQQAQPAQPEQQAQQAQPEQPAMDSESVTVDEPKELSVVTERKEITTPSGVATRRSRHTQETPPERYSESTYEDAGESATQSRAAGHHGSVSAVSPAPVMTRARIRELSAPSTRSAVEGPTRSSLRDRADHEAAHGEQSNPPFSDVVRASHASAVETTVIAAVNTGPQRVSAKARMQDEAQRSDLTRVATNILLTGDPDIDQTRVNLDRIAEPIVQESARDASNYVPRRARSTN